MKWSLFLVIALTLLFGCEQGQVKENKRQEPEQNNLGPTKKTEKTAHEAKTPERVNPDKPQDQSKLASPVTPTTPAADKTPKLAIPLAPTVNETPKQDDTLVKTPDKLLPVKTQQPVPQSPRITTNERKAIAMLNELVAAQQKFKKQIIVDQDRDGSGEYGFIQELAGTAKPRSRASSGISLIDRELGESAREYGGIAVKDGYCFCCYLPGPKKALAEGVGELPELKEMEKDWEQAYAVDFQENNFVIYAWPAVPGTTGIRTFAIDRAMRATFCTKREYDLQNPPRPQDAMRVIEELPEHLQEAQNVTGGLAVNRKGYNGLIWKTIK